MERILVDTSVWVNFFKDVKTKATDYLEDNINDIIITTSPTIVQETLQGVVTPADYHKVSTLLNNLVKLIEEPYSMALDAAIFYRKLRKEGIIIRKPNDCLIAAYAIENKIPLLHDDKDFDFIATKSDLEIIKFSY